MTYLPGMELERAACEERKLENNAHPSPGTWQAPRVLTRSPPCGHDPFIDESRAQVTSVPAYPLILVALS